jgi:GTP-binding protein Era
LVGNEGVNLAFEQWSLLLPNAKIFPVSALEKIHTRELLDRIIKALPESPPYFPKDDISDRTMRFFCSEIMREKIFMNYDREIPYSCEVMIEEYREEIDIVHVSAVVLAERESQKRIIIGHQGSALKRTATQARKDMESFIGKKVMLKTFVKVDDNWRNDERKLRNYGYLE